MKVAIAGGTGLIGSRLCEMLKKRGDDVIVLTRSQSKMKNAIPHVKWLNGEKPEPMLEGIDAFINLAGVSLNEGRWTIERKEAIYKSRMESTEEIIRIIGHVKKKPDVLVNASAIGIYPASINAVYTEESQEQSSDFLGTTVADWEEKALEANEFGVRVCLTRFGVVLGRGSGALPLIALPYLLFVGGTVGSGEQWLSWVHVDDVCGAIIHAIETPELEGPINVTSPNAKRMKQFGKTIGRTLNRPHWLPVPSTALKLALGEKSQLVLEGQYVVPEKLLSSGYRFQFASLEDAIIDLYN
ncbi:TIGR01777 family oxidoreductase [Lysinibacillus odysseyi]|uniref:Multidrug MFS transporter n=1 Tax=Lysinibacillus odysseyi 34hs-1 = NBRC 100172 TaxID=1220589 RepID=A0A0A3JMS8_9BACI|nr:TIGR01777 family oxidoreductase [Lysinibacillus odysseyi]KGR88292.1 multidrug MFS transporter [Lysinibacillus odysseyi 34hs-1 = NBRC 100172]